MKNYRTFFCLPILIELQMNYVVDFSDFAAVTVVNIDRHDRMIRRKLTDLCTDFMTLEVP